MPLKRAGEPELTFWVVQFPGTGQGQRIAEKALREINSSEAIPHLINALSSISYSSRDIAAKILKDIKRPEAISGLIFTFLNSHESARRNAEEILEHFAVDHALIPFLESRVKEKNRLNSLLFRH